MDNDTIDLRPYLAGIAKRWYWPIGIAMIGAIAAWIIAMQIQPTFTATSSVLVFIRQTGSQVGVNEPILRIETIDTGARRQGLVALAQSNTIEAQLPDDAIQQAAPADYRPGRLTQRISARAEGDLISISARGSSPQQAKALADTWTRTFAAYANETYTDQHSEVRLAGDALLPYEPTSPRTAMMIALGLGLGFLLGITLALAETSTGRSLLRFGRTADAQHAASYPSPNQVVQTDR
jgi:uncharacterized protein involved in exopolysaccharide biosynthesis